MRKNVYGNATVKKSKQNTDRFILPTTICICQTNKILPTIKRDFVKIGGWKNFVYIPQSSNLLQQ